MRVFRGLHPAADAGAVITIGNFDGMHLGHQALLRQLLAEAQSRGLRASVLTNLGSVNALHKPAVEQAGFAVLKAPDIPSILIETAFISNPEEEKRLTDSDYQDKLAEAIMRGIRQYLARNPSFNKA